MGCMDSSGSQTKSSGESKTKEQKAGLKQALDIYTPTLGQGQKIYQGETTAGFSGLQNSTFDFATNGGFVKSQADTDKYFKDVYEDPTMKQWKSYVAPTIREEYAGPGFWGSARAGAVAKSAQDTGDTLNQQRTQLNWDVGESNKAGALQMFDLGAKQQEFEQAKINADIEKFAAENRITDPENMSILMGLLGLNYSTSYGRKDVWGDQLGYLWTTPQGASTAAGMFA